MQARQLNGAAAAAVVVGRARKREKRGENRLFVSLTPRGCCRLCREMEKKIGALFIFCRETQGEGMAAAAGASNESSSSSMMLLCSGDILHAVQMGRIFADSKHFVYVPAFFFSLSLSLSFGLFFFCLFEARNCSRGQGLDTQGVTTSRFLGVSGVAKRVADKSAGLGKATRVCSQIL